MRWWCWFAKVVARLLRCCQMMLMVGCLCISTTGTVVWRDGNQKVFGSVLFFGSVLWVVVAFYFLRTILIYTIHTVE
jgi:hypothetical protein